MDTPEGKKRGRRAKSDKLDTEEPVAAAAPKKRGRKPKGGKIVQHLTELPEPVDVSPNVILHLKCSIDDADSSQPPATVQGHDLAATKTTDLGYHLITQPAGPEHQGCDAKTEEKSTSKALNTKLKNLQRSLHMNSVPNECSACFWCTCGFDNPAVFIPRHQINDEYQVYGNFCSPECAAAYLMSEEIDTSSKFERYQFLNYMYAKVYDYKRNIRPAPDPRYVLNKFCGSLSIHEYRSLSQNGNLLLVIDKPLTRVLPEIHEDNEDFMLGAASIPSNTTLRLRRQGAPVPSKNEILCENFGI